MTSEAWAGEVAGTVARAYDNNFRVTSHSVNGGNTTSFSYDNDSLLTGAGSLTLTRSAQNGLLTATTLGSATDAWGYSVFGEPLTYSAAYGGSTIFSNQFTRDKLGRITQKTETIGGITDTYAYRYDTAGRLDEVKKNNVVVSTYAYDSNSNRLTHTTSGGTTSGTYDAQDRLTQYGPAAYTYTANGELATKTIGAQTTAYQYDQLGNLTAATLPDGTQIAYVIDGRNRRVGKKVNGVLTQGFLYLNSLEPIAELDGTGAIISTFVYASKAHVPDYMVKAGVTYRIISDHLGSPRLVVDASTGAVVQRIDYDEFGNVVSDTNPGFQPFGFAGGIYDSHTGLTRFGARDYDPHTARWAAKDPIVFAGGDTNLYGYTLNDPINLLDPDGLLAVTKILPKVIKLVKGRRAVKAISVDDAVRLHREGESFVMCPSKDAAKESARKAGGGSPPIHEIDTKTGARHYHPRSRAGHFLYGLAGALTFSYYAEGHGGFFEGVAFIADLFSPLSVPQDVLDIKDAIFE